MLGRFIEETGDNPFNCDKHNFVYKNRDLRDCHYCGIRQRFTWDDEGAKKEWRTYSPNETLHLFAGYREEK